MKYEYNKQSLLKKLISLRDGFIARDKSEVDEWNTQFKSLDELPKEWWKQFVEIEKVQEIKVVKEFWGLFSTRMPIMVDKKVLNYTKAEDYLGEFGLTLYYVGDFWFGNIPFIDMFSVGKTHYNVGPLGNSGQKRYTTPHDLNNLISLLQSTPDEVTSITLEQKDLEIMKKYEDGMQKMTEMQSELLKMMDEGWWSRSYLALLLQ